MSNVDERIEHALKAVYGDWAKSSFPQDLPRAEANRRYLWTDAFAIMALVGLSRRVPARATEFLSAGTKVRNAVFSVLGQPSRYPMLPRAVPVPLQKDGVLTPFVGLRIGKLEERPESDADMKYDGQYAHYTDKFLLALLLLGDAESLDLAEQLLIDLAPHFITSHGVHWKLNVDSSPIPELGSPVVRGDTLNWAIVSTLLAQSRPSVSPIRDQLLGLVRGEGAMIGPSPDPLGWGLQWLELCHLSNKTAWCQQTIDAMLPLTPLALSPQHFALPFRLYGAIIGAKLAPQLTPRAAEAAAMANWLLAKAASKEEAREIGRSPHSCINRIMFAVALEPSVLIAHRADLEL
jgi:hypothetical protein